MKGILIALAVLLVSGCTPKEEEKTDWLIGRWHLVGCTYVNQRTGESGMIDKPGFKTWEFNEWGMLIVDGDKNNLQGYWHGDGRIVIGMVAYYEVLHGKDVMQLERREATSVTTYTFRR